MKHFWNYGQDGNEHGLEIDDKAIQQLFQDHHEEIKERIKQYGRFTGYSTQEELAKALHVTREFLNGVLNGRKKCPVNLYKSLCEKLDFEPIYLFDLFSMYERKELKNREDFLRAYILSFGITFNKKNNAVLKTQDGSYNSYSILIAIYAQASASASAW